MQKVLVTGSTGRIGKAFVAAYQDHYEFVLTDLREPAHPIDGPHRFVQADLSDANAAAALCQDIDAVVHLAGVPDPNAEFDEVLTANILATTYLIEAAQKAGCRRFVYASSAQTIEGYPVDRQVVPGMAVAPANLYGVSKCYGEALYPSKIQPRGGIIRIEFDRACQILSCQIGIRRVQSMLSGHAAQSKLVDIERLWRPAQDRILVHLRLGQFGLQYARHHVLLFGVLRRRVRTGPRSRDADVVVGDRIATAAAWTYLDPTPRFADVAGHWAFYAQAVDECWVDDERVDPNDGDFYGGWITGNVTGPFKGAAGTLFW